MNTIRVTLVRASLALALVSGLASLDVNAQGRDIPNRLIDYPGFMGVAKEVWTLRQERRLSEEEFIEMSKQEGTIILDTRSLAKYQKMHIAGAVHLNFSDITEETLRQVIPSQQTRVLIYCNNNFVNAPESFPTKRARASLNIPTFITLYVYGYRNIYELGPVLDPSRSKLSFGSGN